MFDDEHATVTKQVGLKAKIVHDEPVIRFVRRIEKRDVPASRMVAAGKVFGGEALDVGLRFRNAELVEVLFDQRTGSF